MNDWIPWHNLIYSLAKFFADGEHKKFNFKKIGRNSTLKPPIQN